MGPKKEKEKRLTWMFLASKVVSGLCLTATRFLRGIASTFAAKFRSSLCPPRRREGTPSRSRWVRLVSACPSAGPTGTLGEWQARWLPLAGGGGQAGEEPPPLAESEDLFCFSNTSQCQNSYFSQFQFLGMEP